MRTREKGKRRAEKELQVATEPDMAPSMEVARVDRIASMAVLFDLSEADRGEVEDIKARNARGNEENGRAIVEVFLRNFDYQKAMDNVNEFAKIGEAMGIWHTGDLVSFVQGLKSMAVAAARAGEDAATPSESQVEDQKALPDDDAEDTADPDVATDRTPVLLRTRARALREYFRELPADDPRKLQGIFVMRLVNTPSEDDSVDLETVHEVSRLIAADSDFLGLEIEGFSSLKRLPAILESVQRLEAPTPELARTIRGGAAALCGVVAEADAEAEPLEAFSLRRLKVVAGRLDELAGSDVAAWGDLREAIRQVVDHYKGRGGSLAVDELDGETKIRDQLRSFSRILELEKEIRERIGAADDQSRGALEALLALLEKGNVLNPDQDKASQASAPKPKPKRAKKKRSASESQLVQIKLPADALDSRIREFVGKKFEEGDYFAPDPRRMQVDQEEAALLRVYGVIREMAAELGIAQARDSGFGPADMESNKRKRRVVFSAIVRNIRSGYDLFGLAEKMFSDAPQTHVKRQGVRGLTAAQKAERAEKLRIARDVISLMLRVC